MKKNKNRNELSIFEELRLKPSTNARSPEHYPREYSLHKLNVLCKVDKKNNPISWWKKRPNGEFMQVNEFGEMIFSSDKRYEKTIPKSKNLKKNKSKILVTVNKYNMPVTYWVKDNEGDLIQVNLKEEDVGVEMKIKSWLRDKAIGAVSLEISSMKKKAYEYSKDELMRMIEAEENKAIKKGGWKAVRIAALSALGLPFLGFL
tara:strand:+ start:56 stop:664 length:609 start_codon:yes stop_codon:yes gene_type:complete